MKKALNLLGFDFGASSGRAMLGSLNDGKLTIEEVHRFSNDPVKLCGRFVWDIPRLFYEMKQALLKLSRSGLTVDAIGIDTWGVDFGLLDKNGHLLGLPVHYRDARTEGMPEKVHKIISDEELFSRTGIAFNSFNIQISKHSFVRTTQNESYCTFYSMEQPIFNLFYRRWEHYRLKRTAALP